MDCYAQLCSSSLAYLQARHSEEPVTRLTGPRSSKGPNLIAGAEHAQHGALEAQRSRLLLLPRQGQALPGLLRPLTGQPVGNALQRLEYSLQAQLPIVLQRTCSKHEMVPIQSV